MIMFRFPSGTSELFIFTCKKTPCAPQNALMNFKGIVVCSGDFPGFPPLFLPQAETVKLAL
ncbi:hypothetical protein D3H55_23280 [Bacillus salacetis]|uniref:Uncharacterized protein n=1 Tax=Bacillus salacetis TaxID=2315464 RepID=A0A3A1QLG4_9BACI|nr:hypothetical protein D3H55_23280 [Bacillus salacetis]